MLLLKACPHCRQGDLIVGHEEDGPVVTCLQCGLSLAGDSRRVAELYKNGGSNNVAFEREHR